MNRTRLTLAAAGLSAALAVALGAIASAPGRQPETPPETVEAPDGTRMPVLSRREVSLVIEELRVGTGAEVERKSTITVHYHGTLPDGTVFDSTRGKEPLKFELARLIPGWQAGLRGMKVGGLRRLTIAPELAYGDKDRKDESGKVVIPAGSTLTFSIGLVAAETPAEPPAPGEAAKAGPITTPSGLIIEDLVVGTGEVCPPGATVTIHYRGTLTDGKEFDSSLRSGQPATFPLGSLVAGWQEGIPGMKVGGKRRLTVPPALGYGAAGFPPDIPPNATLIFEIELFGFK